MECKEPPQVKKTKVRSNIRRESLKFFRELYIVTGTVNETRRRSFEREKPVDDLCAFDWVSDEAVDRARSANGVLPELPSGSSARRERDTPPVPAIAFSLPHRRLMMKHAPVAPETSSVDQLPRSPR